MQAGMYARFPKSRLLWSRGKFHSAAQSAELGSLNHSFTRVYFPIYYFIPFPFSPSSLLETLNSLVLLLYPNSVRRRHVISTGVHRQKAVGQKKVLNFRASDMISTERSTCL
uniref:Uncharacterized protein n=1 Tax=Anguilla anguilla TaxID=7936 RepID=A0A0E9X7D2_ANGAN